MRTSLARSRIYQRDFKSSSSQMMKHEYDVGELNRSTLQKYYFGTYMGPFFRIIWQGRGEIRGDL